MAKVVPLPTPAEEPEEQECPKCPPVGSPAWMATFADIATLLMAFFVLILSFAEFNSPRFKMIAGSLKKSFGVQREIPVTEQPKGTTVLSLNFSPSPSPSVTKELTQETEDREKPEIDTETADGAGDEAQQMLAEALEKALASGQVTVEVQNGEVVMNFDQPVTDPQQFAQQLLEAAQAVDQARQQDQDVDDIKMSGLADDLETLAQMAVAMAEGEDTQDTNATDQPETGGQTPDAGQGAEADLRSAEVKSAIADARLRVALRQEVAEGLVTIEERDDKIFVTVGAGGAFPSGKADLTDQARDVIEKITLSAVSSTANITVTGHTDNVPLEGGPYTDNWGLAAARASSVVREIGASGLIDPARLRAVSLGESAPVDSNDTEAGRERNRRIEIEIDYAD